MLTDRRRHQREPVEQYCSIECSSEGWFCGGKIRDISEGGMRVDMLKVPDVKSELLLYTIESEQRQSVRKAIVAWVMVRAAPWVGASAGLQFA
ncbi:MAG: PilZ domain-containing protein [Thermodesulfobacteriota bacterium]